MSHTICGKLNKAATQFQAGESTGFGLRLGVKYYDRESKADAYTNYEAVIFAKAPAQVQFYQQVLVDGAVVEVSGDKLKIRQFQGNNGLSLSIELLDAKLGFVHAPQQAPAQQPQQQRQQPQQQQQQSYNQPRQQPPQGYQPMIGQPMQQAAQQGFNQQSGGGAPDFHDDIPFAPIGLSCKRLLHCI
jgi:single-strand DNA-binding protein